MGRPWCSSGLSLGMFMSDGHRSCMLLSGGKHNNSSIITTPPLPCVAKYSTFNEASTNEKRIAEQLFCVDAVVARHDTRTADCFCCNLLVVCMYTSYRRSSKYIIEYHPQDGSYGRSYRAYRHRHRHKTGYHIYDVGGYHPGCCLLHPWSILPGW